jgi:pimeloyl-ACP methyl ester carboxylesterase
MAFARVNGIDLYYEIHGGGPPVVLSHGGGSNHLTWFHQTWALMKHYKVVTFDHRGFGSSTAGDLGPEAYVDDLAALLEHLDIARTAILGQSLGARTAAGFASRYPDRVSVLMLVSGGAGLVAPPPSGHSAQAAQAAAAAKSNSEFIRSVRHQDKFATRDPEKNFLFESIADLNFNVDTSRLLQASKIHHDPAPIAAAGIPTLLIAGEDDTSSIVSMQQLLQLIPSAVYRSIPDTGHHLFFERPYEFNQIVRDFLRAHADRLA